MATADPSADNAGRAAMATIRGEAQAQAVLHLVAKGRAGPNALADAWEALQGDPAARRGFARHVQKHCERHVTGRRAP